MSPRGGRQNLRVHSFERLSPASRALDAFDATYPALKSGLLTVVRFADSLRKQRWFFMSITAETQSPLQSSLNGVFESSEFRSVRDQIRRGARTICISGMVSAPARALAIAAL